MTLSVIIPVYNAKAYLQTMVNSILSQSFADFELLLIDDGSSDGGGEVCDALADSDSRIKVFHTANQGVSLARNFGLAQARGQYVHFADSDDRLQAGMYEAFAGAAEQNEADLMLCGTRQIDTRKKTAAVIAPGRDQIIRGETQLKEYLDGITEHDMRCLIHYVWNKWYKRSLLLEHNCRFSDQLSYGEDYLFNCHVLANIERMRVIKTPYYDYFLRGTGLVSAFQPEPWKIRQLLLDAHIQLYRRYGIWNQNKEQILKEEGKMCFAALRSLNSSRCSLTRQEKQRFLSQLRQSESMDHMLYYLKHSDKFMHRIWFFMLQNWGIGGLESVLWLDRQRRQWEEKRKL